jgi:hypothetical protein
MHSQRSWLMSLAVTAGLVCAWGLLADDGTVDAWLQMAWSFGRLGDMPIRPGVPEAWRVRLVWFVFLALVLFVLSKPSVAARSVGGVFRSIRYGLALVRNSVRGMALWERAYFYGALVVCAGLRTSHAITAPVMADEALTWLLFTAKGPLACVTFYPAPNNHLLHSLITSCSAQLPVDTLFALRLPVIAIAGLAQALMHLLFRRLFGASATLIVLACVLGSPAFLYYGAFSRGYMLVLLAFIGAFAAVVFLVRTGDRQALGLLWICCVVGLFTMPSFLYPALLLFGYLLVRTKSPLPSRSSILRAGLVTAAATLILYVPALILNGIDAFISNIWVRPTGWHAVTQGWWKHFGSTFSWLTGLPFAFQGMMVLIATSLLLTRGRDRGLVLFSTFILIASLAIPFVHGVLPFERTWIYLLLPIAILLGLVVSKLTSWVERPAYFVPLAVAIYASGEYRYTQALPLQEYTAYHARDLFEVVRIERDKDILCEMSTVGVHLVFEMETRGIPFTFAVIERHEDRNARLDAGKYALVLVDRSRPLVHLDYDQVYADGIQRLYRRRER